MERTALLINPPIYDVQYWPRWSMPHGLLKVGSYLSQKGYRTKLVDCLATDEKRKVRMRKSSLVRIGSNEEWIPDSWGKKLSDGERVKYCFGKNKGYGTEEHRTAIRTFGYCGIHRKSFRGVREYVNPLL